MKPVDIHQQRPHLKDRLRQDARFLKNWVDNPLLTGAIYPSGKVLSAKLADTVDISGTGPIVELGPGTGPVTEALLARGIAPERLVLIEFSADFCRALKTKFPNVRVIEGDAYAIKQTLAAQGIENISAVVSSLPLLTKPEPERLALLAEAFSMMGKSGTFAQFTYGLTSPIPLDQDIEDMLGLHANVSEIIWNNLPPARVWTYRPSDQPRMTFDKEVAFARFCRKQAANWRDDAPFKPALVLLKRLGDHFDGRKPH